MAKAVLRLAKVVKDVDALADEFRRLKRDLLRVTAERDILKKAVVGSSGQRKGCFEPIRWRLNAQCF